MKCVAILFMMYSLLGASVDASKSEAAVDGIATSKGSDKGCGPTHTNTQKNLKGILALGATDADLLQIPHVGEACLRDMRAMQNGKITFEELCSKPHMKRVLRVSGQAIGRLLDFLSDGESDSSETTETVTCSDTEDAQGDVAPASGIDKGVMRENVMEEILQKLEGMSLRELHNSLQVITTLPRQSIKSEKK